MDPSRIHGRTPSNSFRISINRSHSPPRSTRHAGSSLYPSASSNSLLGDVRLWLTARSGRTGPRRWIYLGLIVLLYVSYHKLARSAPANSVETNSAVKTPVGSNVKNWFVRGKDEIVEDVPRVDRWAMEKLRLLELHEQRKDAAAAENEEENSVEPVEKEEEEPETESYEPKLDAAEQVVIDDSPPIVTEIPEVPKNEPERTLGLKRVQAEILDAEVCPDRNGQACAFIVPAWLGEQETKAQSHLYQLGLIALALNRTLVLPNVAKSRLGTCFKSPFSFYYKQDSLSKLGIKTMTQSDFIKWSDSRVPAPSAQIVTMNTQRRDYPQGAIEIDSASDPTLVPQKPTRNLCLKTPRSRLDFSQHSPIAIFPVEGYHKNEQGRTNFGESAVNTLRSQQIAAKSWRGGVETTADSNVHPDVFVINYEMRYPMMSPAAVKPFLAEDAAIPLPFAHFAYADTWNKLAEGIAMNLSPFIAIHWRTETLPPGNLAPCARSLISRLAELKKQFPTISNVYLATDYPIEDLEQGAIMALPHSGTFAKVVTEQHHAAFRLFLKEFHSKLSPALRLTTFTKELKTYQLPENLVEMLKIASGGEFDATTGLTDLDSGLYGILDKMIAMRAEIFLTGVSGIGSIAAAGACSKLSSFTNQLIDAREQTREAQREELGLTQGEEELARVPGRLWNLASHWSLKGDVHD